MLVITFRSGVNSYEMGPRIWKGGAQGETEHLEYKWTYPHPPSPPSAKKTQKRGNRSVAWFFQPSYFSIFLPLPPPSALKCFREELEALERSVFGARGASVELFMEGGVEMVK